MTMPDAPLWLSVAEAARLTGLSDAHVRRHAPVERVGRRVLVPAWWVHHPRHGEETDGRGFTGGPGRRARDTPGDTPDRCAS